MKDGLSRGDVPTSATEGVNAVWLTTDASATGHGLSDGGEVTAQDRLNHLALRGELLPENASHANKRALCITVRIQSSDRRLKHWPKWARKRLEPGWYNALDRAGSEKSDTWKANKIIEYSLEYFGFTTQ